MSRARIWPGLGLGVGTRAASIRGKSPKKSNSRVSRSQMAAGDRAAHDRSGRGADDDVRHLIRHALGMQPMGKAEHPGREIFAAAAERQGAVLAPSERPVGRNREGHRQLVVEDDVRRDGGPRLGGRLSRRHRESGGRSQDQVSPSKREGRGHIGFVHGASPSIATDIDGRQAAKGRIAPSLCDAPAQR